MRFRSLFLSMCLIGLALVSCKKKDDHSHEGELITTVRLTFQQYNPTTAVAIGAPQTFQWRDADGDSNLNPTIQTINLTRNAPYTVLVTLLNELANPAEDITNEIRKEADKHQFFYMVSSGLGLNIIYVDASIAPADIDTQGRPTGIALLAATTNAATNGNLRVVLKHEGTKNNTIGTPSTDGETDIDVTFPVQIN